MAYTETTTRSWTSRLGDSFKGIVFGFVLIAAGTCLLWWNEGRTFKTAGAIGEAELVTQDVSDISRLDPSLGGKVIHATGRAETQETLRDPIFGVEANALCLRRKVEYFQWREHSHSETRKKLGGGEETVTTYTYDTGWEASPVDSNSFKDPEYKGRNSILARFDDERIWAKDITFGAYKLPDFLSHSIGGETQLSVERLDASAISSHITAPKGSYAGQLINGDDKTVYIGENPNSPKVGDVRITFYQIPPAEVSIIAQVDGSTFKEFLASNGYTFSSLEMGRVDSAEMFKDARSSNTIMAWVLRLVGILVIVGGLKTILAPLSVLADVIPILGTIVGAGTGFVSWVLGLAWSLIVIAVAWVRFRPLIAGGLIAVAVLLIALPYIKGRKSA